MAVAALRGVPVGPGYGGSGMGSVFRLLLPGTTYDYEREAGDKWSNSAVYNGLRWIQTQVTQPRLYVGKLAPDGKAEEIPNHPLTRLLRRPNRDKRGRPVYSGKTLLQATALSHNVSGNAYWLIERSNSGAPLNLWWLPHWSIFPQYPPDGSEWLTHWLYRPDGVSGWYRIEVEDLVHFRSGIDPRQPRLGLAPLAAVCREIFGDNEALTWEAALYRNCAIPGLMICPADKETEISDEGRKNLISQLETEYTGDNRGRPLVPPYQVKVEKLSWSPADLGGPQKHFLFEQRVAGALGLHPILCGFGAGLDKSTYSNTEQAVKQGYNGNILPFMDELAETLDTQLLPEWETVREPQVSREPIPAPAPDVLDVLVDTQHIDALSEDKNEAHKRVREDFKVTGITRNEFRVETGREPFPEGDPRGEELYTPGSGKEVKDEDEDEPEEEPVEK
jgi:HK97 family phage portal protein